MGSFTESLWSSITNIYKAIVNHPFIQGLVDGSLEEEKFKFYVIQDALYLSEYSRALSIAASKAPHDEWAMMFNDHARMAILVERSLHEGFFKEWGLGKEGVYSTPMTPTNLAYTSYLKAVAYSSPFHELLAALLPCYWIYWEVGKELEKQGSRKRLYQRWIDTYSSDEYAGICKAVLDITDEYSRELTEAQRLRMKNHFMTTSKYEYMFWDSAYRLERWPL
ncbi:MAG: thiaminase II [Nitrososphaerota archaeon]